MVEQQCRKSLTLSGSSPMLCSQLLILKHMQFPPFRQVHC